MIAAAWIRDPVYSSGVDRVFRKPCLSDTVLAHRAHRHLVLLRAGRGRQHPRRSALPCHACRCSGRRAQRDRRASDLAPRTRIQGRRVARLSEMLGRLARRHPHGTAIRQRSERGHRSHATSTATAFADVATRTSASHCPHKRKRRGARAPRASVQPPMARHGKAHGRKSPWLDRRYLSESVPSHLRPARAFLSSAPQNGVAGSVRDLGIRTVASARWRSQRLGCRGGRAARQRRLTTRHAMEADRSLLAGSIGQLVPQPRNPTGPRRPLLTLRLQKVSPPHPHVHI